jgi:hypothetical protein
MKLVILTEKQIASSLRMMALDLQKTLRLQGHDVLVVDHIGEHLVHANILNLVPEYALKLFKQKRFLHFDSLVNVFAPNLKDYAEVDLPSLLYTSISYPMVYHSPYHYSSAMAKVRGLFAPARARALMRNMHHVDYGILPGFRDRGENRRDEWIVPFNRYNQTQKNIRLHSEVSRQVAQTLQAKHGVQIRHHFKYGGDLRMEDAPELQQYIVAEQPATREEYMQSAREMGMFICTANFESFGIYYLELLASGVVGVFLDKEWNRELLPEYPFRTDCDNLAAMAVQVYENFDAAKNVLRDTVLSVIDRKYRIDHFASRMVELLDEQINRGKDEGA